VLFKNNTESSPISQWIIDILGITLLLGVFYAMWLGSHPLFTPDEGRYSEVAREMVASGDYITPRLNGVAFLDKPVFYYWLQTVSINVIGLKEWALRFWPAFMGVLGSLVIYITGHLLFNRRTGIISALILATSPLYYGAAHYANLDLEVAVLISNALLFFITAIQSTSKQRAYAFFLTAYVFCGLAALTKGLIGIVFPAIIVGLWVVLLNRWSVLKRMSLATGIVIFIAITAPWYILVQKANPEFFQFFFVTQQVSRFLTTADFNNKTAAWFYAPIVLAGFFPWTILLFQALTRSLQNVWKNRQQHQVELFLLIWLFFVFAFFSIPKSKTVGYILPIFPALALLTGNYINRLWDHPKAKSITFATLLFSVGSAIIFIACLFSPHYKNFAIDKALVPYLTFTGLTFLIASISLCIFGRGLNLKRFFSILTTCSIVFLLTFIASASVINQKSIKPLATQLKPTLQPSDEVVTFYKYYQDLPLYLERRITIVQDWDSPDIPHNDNWVRELWYGMVFQDTKDWLIDKNTFWQRWNSNKRLFVLTDESYYHDFISQAKSKVYKISQYNSVIVLSNHPTVARLASQ
jgi:4-amino-4-deoxy-L-arabinose transferase-like glycosyltransferase